MLFTDKQTDRQTNATKNITSFAKEVINKPREMKAVNEIYKRHSDTSEAKVNEDKTQIFRLGEEGNEAAERDAGIHDKVYSKVTILGAKFCKDKRAKLQKTSRKQMDY